MQETTSDPNISALGSIPYLAEELLSFLKDTPDKSRPTFINRIWCSPQIQQAMSGLDYQFQDTGLMAQALSHSSFVHEFPELKQESNERLEFLGDAILGALVANLLMKKYPNLLEGKLSQLRSAVVNELAWAELAIQIQLGHALLLGRGEIKAEGMKKEALLANVFEAMMGAIFLDGGFICAQNSLQYVLNQYRRERGMDFLDLSRLDDFDCKSRLQEKVMELYKTLPTYRAQQLYDGRYAVELYIQGALVETFIDLSKKKAEREVARRALENLRGGDYAH
ncbi:MAG: ribonuclease III [Pseudomonadota bacterium]